jgi:hypothetical protein
MAQGLGSIIGSAIGGAVGSAVPGVGTSIGSAAGQIIGGVSDQAFAGRREKASMPMWEDPEQRRLLEELRSKRKAMEMGVDVTTNAALNENAQSGEAVRNAITRVTGGNAGQSVDALLKSQRQESAANNQAIGQLATRLPYYQGLEDNLLDRVAQRKLELDLRNVAQATAEKAQYGKENLMNLSTGVQSGRFDADNTGLGQSIGDYFTSLRVKDFNRQPIEKMQEISAQPIPIMNTPTIQ